MDAAHGSNPPEEECAQQHGAQAHMVCTAAQEQDDDAVKLLACNFTHQQRLAVCAVRGE